MDKLGFGCVVQSTAGRDKYRVFLVTEIDFDNMVRPVIVANGELRRLSDRKHKNPSHLKLVAWLTDEEKKELCANMTDEQILTICKRYDNFQK